jgi:hypothetical protein
VRQARNGVDTHCEPNSIVRVDESGSEPFSFGRRWVTGDFGPLNAMSQGDREDAVVWIDEALKVKAK